MRKELWRESALDLASFEDGKLAQVCAWRPFQPNLNPNPFTAAPTLILAPTRTLTVTRTPPLALAPT